MIVANSVRRCVEGHPHCGVFPNGSDDKVYVYSVNHATGELTQLHGSPFQAGSDPYSVAFSPEGNLLAVGNTGHPGSISVYAVHLAPKS